MLIEFSDPAGLDVARCGGKGASLARGTQAGLPVPEGMVVPVAAYTAWLAEATPDTTPHTLPAGLAPALAEWLARWPAAARFAVRSSATAEDGLEHAFAGQHETYLNVPTTEVAARIVECWRSLQNERAVVYRHEAGLRDSDVAMAVVVQRMIPAERAGVGFCLNPVTGALDEFALDACFGVGETVVGGEYAVDHVIIHRDTAEIISATIAHKTHCLRVVATGTAETPVDTPDAATLDASQLAALANLMNQVEGHYGYPQDIEWAFEGEQLYLLQSRPITRLPEHWTRDESAERFPNPVSRLCWEMSEDGFHRSLAHSFALMGLPAYRGKWFARKGQYVYGNQTAVELFGRLALTRVPRPTLENLPELAKHIWQEFFWVMELPSRWARDLDTYLLQLGKLQAEDLAHKDLPALFAHLQALRQAGSDYFLPNIAISITQRTLCSMLLHLLQGAAGKEAGAAIHADLLAWCDTKTARVNQDLWELGQAIRNDAECCEILREAGGEALLASGRVEQVVEIRAKLEHIQNAHGHREWDFDPYVAPWRDTPGLILELVRGMLDRPQSPADEGRQARIRMQQAEQLVMQHCPEPARYFISELIRLARLYTSLDDVEHYQTLRLNLPVREVLREMGRHLQAQGLIGEDMDICFAGIEALTQAVADASLLPQLATDIRSEKAAYLAALQESPQQDLSTPATATEPASGTLQGIPGSPGIVRAPICHVRSTADFARFVQGAILVARTTNPAWTPLFFRASAVVTESGGPLSHGAVTARELGLPAVMAITAALDRLPDGMLAEVDGRAGTVRIIED